MALLSKKGVGWGWGEYARYRSLLMRCSLAAWQLLVLPKFKSQPILLTFFFVPCLKVLCVWRFPVTSIQYWELLPHIRKTRCFLFVNICIRKLWRPWCRICNFVTSSLWLAEIKKKKKLCNIFTVIFQQNFNHFFAFYL